MTSSPDSAVAVRRWRAAVLSFVLLALAVVVSDAAMVAVCGVARVLVHAAVLQWVLATGVIAVAGFCLFGAPQVVAWSRSTPPEASDARTRWSLRLLGRGGPFAFVAASLTGGPLAVGWFLGRERHRRAYLLTAVSAVLMAAFWSAAYLGLLRLIPAFN